MCVPHCCMYCSCSSAVNWEYCTRLALPPPVGPTGPLLVPIWGVTGPERLASGCSLVIAGWDTATGVNVAMVGLAWKPSEGAGEAVSLSPPARHVRGRGSSGGDAGDSNVKGDVTISGAWRVLGLRPCTAPDTGVALLANGDDPGLGGLFALWLPVPSFVETSDVLFSPVCASSCRPLLRGTAC